MTLNIKIVDAFTQIPHTGNPAGVVLESKDLTENLMQLVARELNLSETAFILPPSKLEADVRIRWFSPVCEVPLCGHATIAAFHVLAENGMLGMEQDGDYHFKLETSSEILPVKVNKNQDKAFIELGLKLPTFIKATSFHKVDLMRIFRIELKEIDRNLPFVYDKYLYLPVRRLHTLYKMKPNFLMMNYFLESRKLHGICVYTTETVARESKVHSRFFAPNYGINEDPVTGSSHGPLAVILYNAGLLNVEGGSCVFQAEQGDVIGRRGRIQVELLVENNVPVSVKIGGYAVTVMQGEMLLEN